MALTQAKQDLLDQEYKMSMKVELLPHEIILLVQKAWDASFVRIEKNRNAIANRGWNPLNRNLLTMPDIRGTMTEDDLSNESSNNVFLPTIKACANEDTSPSYDPFF